MMRVSEYFYSIQGEGRYAGTPAVFLRMAGCNLTCGIDDKSRVKNWKTLEDIKKAKSEKASWVCDTIAVWTKGKEYMGNELYSEWLEKDFIKYLQLGAHLIITGGEPLIHQRDDEFISFLSGLKRSLDLFIEIETNGTIMPSFEIDELIDHYNVSPKLSNSAMPKERRFNKEVLEFFIARPHIFKFVVSDTNDLKEIVRDFKFLINTDKDNIYLMPACDNRKSLVEESKKVAEYCKFLGLKYSPRLQLMIWNKVVGV